MSHIGKKPIIIPEGVEVTIKDDSILVKGPKGSLSFCFNPQIKIEEKNNNLFVFPLSRKRSKEINALWGLVRSLVNNNIIGVVKGFIKKLEIQGVGYKANVQGKKLILEVGFSHLVEYTIPPDIEVKVEKNIITVEGIDKQKVGQVAAEIRSKRPPEPYKGKGIRYLDEKVRRKVGKKAAAEESGK